MADQTVAQLEQWCADNEFGIVVDAKANGSWVVTLVARRDPVKFAGQTAATTQASPNAYKNALTIAVGKARQYGGRLGK